MALTAEDIQNVSFSIDRKGYDVDEVDVFLERVADEVDAMNKLIEDLEDKLAKAREAVPPAAAAVVAKEVEEGEADEVVADKSGQIAELEARVAELEAQLAEKSANDNAISQALIVAQRSADEIVANARTEASNIVKDADEEADRIIGKAESDRLKIAEAIRALENDRSDVRAEYREMLSNFMADAQRKLAEIDGDSRRAALNAQARADANAANYSAAPVAAAPEAYISPVPAATPTAAPSGYVEKDFSGYGDAADDFVFDID
ncbi:MAG: DivIVA domain-containing protein [Eggerthellaceae bacterium]|nr:DivIVA domain-containing protein [Eggerthellaceae bacterium]